VHGTGSSHIGPERTVDRAGDDGLPPTPDLVGDERCDVVGDAAGGRLRDVKDSG
jgi:hypothetical protein